MWICSVLRAEKSLNSKKFYSRDTGAVLSLLLFLCVPLRNQLFGLQLHLSSPFEGYIHQKLKATEVLCEVWRGGGRGVEQAAAGAQVALHAGAAEDGVGCGEWPFVAAAEQSLSLYGLQQLDCPLRVHYCHRGAAGCGTALHRCRDSGVTDDRWAGGHEHRGGGCGGRRG